MNRIVVASRKTGTIKVGNLLRSISFKEISNFRVLKKYKELDPWDYLIQTCSLFFAVYDIQKQGLFP